VSNNGGPATGGAEAVAEGVAATIRERILGGQLRRGDLMPKQDELLEEFQVSRPSMRAALRILEAEGLITVRRGQVGGAIVHPPRPESLGYFLAMLLQTDDVSLSDVAQALGRIEPICAQLCAEGAKTDARIIDRLRGAHEKTRSVIDSPEEFTHAARRFHAEIVACCPNETLRVMAGAIVAVWSAHEGEWAHVSGGGDEFPNRRLRVSGVEAHEAVLHAIERGDGPLAARAYGQHLDHAQADALRQARQKGVNARLTRQYGSVALRDSTAAAD
jgi:GntR family transcriptional repressor for pyruvate dehydrogenase complex